MIMIKKLLLALIALLIPVSALAEAYEGRVTALTTLTVTSEITGSVEKVLLEAGSRVCAGDPLLQLKGERVFARQDGAISLIYADEGDTVENAVLELSPYERYVIYCTVDKAYQSAESTLVHEGETVYARCTADGTHRAVGLLTQIDGEAYRVMTLGGELYVGETVYLYRDPDFTADQRVGIGTVLSSDPETYEASGTLTRLCVSEGDSVERGQLLCELNGGSVGSPVSGILTSVEAQPGDVVQEGQAVAQIVPEGQIAVNIQIDETAASQIKPGQSAELTPAGGEGDSPIPGTVLDCAWVAEDGLYTVRILPDPDASLPLGMSVTVRL